MEEKVEKKEQPTVAEMITAFNSGWEAAVELVVRLTGLGKAAARNAILVAIVPLLTAAVQMVNWAYLYIHYHLGYNVPVAYLTVDTPWLVSFGIGVLLLAGIVLICVCLTMFMSNHMPSTRGVIYAQIAALWFSIMIGAFILGNLMVIVRDKTEISVLLRYVTIWFFAFSGILMLCVSKHWTEPKVRKNTEFPAVIIIISDEVSILSILIWFLKPYLSIWNLDQYINVYLWAVLALLALMFAFVGGLYITLLTPQKNAVRFQISLLIVSAIFAFFLTDDYFSRSTPYAIVESSQQVVAYQSKEISVLEPATIEVDEETNEVTLTIDTSQQQIVDSTTLSYEYQSFDTVNIE